MPPLPSALVPDSPCCWLPQDSPPLEANPPIEPTARKLQVDASEFSLAASPTAEITAPPEVIAADQAIAPEFTENSVAEPWTPDNWGTASPDILASSVSEADGQAETIVNRATAPPILDAATDDLTAATTFSAADLGWPDASPTRASPTDVSQSTELENANPLAAPPSLEGANPSEDANPSAEATSSEGPNSLEEIDPSEEITPSDELNPPEEFNSEEFNSEEATAPSVWHFLFEPFIALPLNTRITSSTGDIDIDIDIDIGDIASSFNRLNFAFLGKFEAWYENQGVVINTSYFAVGGGRVREFRVPPPLQGTLPGILTADFSADLLKADLMYAYRFSAPPENGYGQGFTEFDLPPISFDLMGGARLYWVAQEATLTSGLGPSLSQSSSNVIVEPVIRGRLRWNTSDNLALKLDADVSGFGLGDAFTFSWSALTALEWMFSGNTSFSAGYQINHVNFDRNGGSNNINFTSHGPYLSFIFRF